ncbi:MAG: hypothetical protein U1E05_03045 [Patescibacteria group bacterium]|nr:hypothetical protein [Patescibacteria group bacterium]
MFEYRERLCAQALREFEALEDLEGIAYATQLLAREKPIHKARSMLERSVRIMRQIGNDAGLISCLDSLASFTCIGGDREACQAMKKEALAIARALDDLENTANMLYSLGITEEGVGPQRAAMFEEAASIFATLGHAFDEGRCLAYCATLACQEDEAPNKEALLRQALELFAKTGKGAMMSYCYDALAELAHDRNDDESAATLELASRTAWPTGEHLEGVNPCPSELNYETLRDAMRRLCGGY